ncbi:hypothetical protein L1987_20409 [Smallanthus sonchifolius]|uniref:Uncharacterized protein n=1 Tax=Smallanthus sonchifolius TaxID=185202 RepID=A0ACB9IRR4_9ASTR|nr:hypothetical protein L1987_20409 [Smallanthus sonchifolius]
MLACMIRRHDLKDDEQQKVEVEQRKLRIKEYEEQVRRIETLGVKIHEICASYQSETTMDEVQLPSSQNTAQVSPPVKYEFSYYEAQLSKPVFSTDIESNVEVEHLSSLESGKYPSSSYIDHECVDDTHLTASSSIHNSFISFNMSHLLWEDDLMQESNVEDTHEDVEIVAEIEDADDIEEEHIPSLLAEFGNELVVLPTADRGEFDPLGDLVEFETILFGGPEG